MAEEKEVLASIQETAAAAAQESDTLPQGNKLEQQLQQEQQAAPAQEQPKGKRGRPKGWRKNKDGAQGEQPQEQQPTQQATTDILTPLINGIIIPLASKKLKRNPAELMYNEQEQALLTALQPPNDFSRPSWPAYIITAVSMIVIKYFQSEEIKPAESKTAAEEKRQPEEIRLHPKNEAKGL